MRKEVTPARLRSFIAAVEKPTGHFGCWFWRGALNGSGYAAAVGGLAYRMAYEWMVGPIPARMDLDHLCRERSCVNPHHLEPVTRAENLRRAREYGPREFRLYCRRGHALVRGNARLWSQGPNRERRVFCYRCHRERNELALRRRKAEASVARLTA